MHNANTCTCHGSSNHDASSAEFHSWFNFTQIHFLLIFSILKVHLSHPSTLILVSAGQITEFQSSSLLHIDALKPFSFKTFHTVFTVSFFLVRFCIIFVASIALFFASFAFGNRRSAHFSTSRNLVGQPSLYFVKFGCFSLDGPTPTIFWIIAHWYVFGGKFTFIISNVKKLF